MKIVYSPNAIARQTDVHNVDVAPLSEMDYSIDKMCCFNTLITTDLQLQKNGCTRVTGQTERERLRRPLVVEGKLIIIRNAIEWSQQGKEAALMLIKEART